MSRINFRKFSPLKGEAERLGASYETVKEYQNLRKRWRDAVRYYKNKYGGVESVDIPADVRSMENRSGRNVQEYLESRIETIRSRLADSVGYLKQRQEQYVKSVVEFFETKLGYDIVDEEGFEKLENMSPKELGQFIDEIGTSFFDDFYRSGKRSTGHAGPTGYIREMNQNNDDVGGRSLDAYADIIRRHLEM